METYKPKTFRLKDMEDEELGSPGGIDPAKESYRNAISKGKKLMLRKAGNGQK